MITRTPFIRMVKRVVFFSSYTIGSIMGTKKHQKRQKKGKKQGKKTGKKLVYRGGDLPQPGQDPNCTSFLGNTCTECKKGYVPVYGKNGKHCAPAVGSTVELQHILPHSITAHTADGDYTLEGSNIPGKKYDCTLCEKGFMPVGPIGERRCESKYVPIDKNDSRYCKDKIRDDCTVCKTMEDGTMMVPAGPLLHRRCIKTGQMWNGEFGPYDKTQLYTNQNSFLKQFFGKPTDKPDEQPAPAVAQPYVPVYQPEQAQPAVILPAIQPVIAPVVQEAPTVVSQPVPPVVTQPAPAVSNVRQAIAVQNPMNVTRNITNKMRRPRPIIKYMPMVRYRNKQTRKNPKQKLIFKGKRKNP